MERFYYSSSTSAVYACGCNAALWITNLYSTFHPLKANRQRLNINFLGGKLMFVAAVQRMLHKYPKMEIKTTLFPFK